MIPFHIHFLEFLTISHNFSQIFTFFPFTSGLAFICMWGSIILSISISYPFLRISHNFSLSFLSLQLSVAVYSAALSGCLRASFSGTFSLTSYFLALAR